MSKSKIPWSKTQIIGLILVTVITFIYVNIMGSEMEKKQAAYKERQAQLAKEAEENAKLKPLPAMTAAPGAPTNATDVGPKPPIAQPAQPTQPATTTTVPTTNITQNDNIELISDGYTVIFSNRGAALRDLRFSQYFESDKKTPLAFLSDRFGKPSFATQLSHNAALQLWEGGVINDTKVEFTRTDATGLTLTKTYEILDGNRITLAVTVSNGSPLAQNVEIYQGGPSGIVDESGKPSGFGMTMAPTMIVGYIDEDGDIATEHEDLNSIKSDFEDGQQYAFRAATNSGYPWLALRNKYFAGVIMPAEPSSIGSITTDFLITKANDQGEGMASMGTTLITQKETLNPNQSRTYKYELFFGTVDAAKAYDPQLEKISQIIWYENKLSIIRDFLLWLLKIIQAVVGNWGVAIILLTCLVKLTIHPLTKKGMKSMYAMQALQPKIKALQAKYKDDKQRIGMEQMKLFKENGVNPLSGCLPILLQMPIYFALFSTLNFAIELRQSSFLWVSDLSQPDRLGALPFSLPFLGTDFNLLPLLFCVSMFLQQKFTPKSPDPNMAQQQKIMMYMMPVMMLFFFYQMSAGLVLYWLMQNVLSLFEQRAIRKKYAPKPSEKKD